jgi:predicted PurR-regulated permease PerM
MFWRNIWVGGGVLALGGVAYSLGTILVPFVIGIVAAYCFDGLVSWLEQWRIPRWIGALWVVLSVLCLIVCLITFALPYLRQELESWAQIGPSLLNRWMDGLEPLQKKILLHFPDLDIAQIKKQLSNQLGDMMHWGIGLLVRIVGSSMAVANLISLAILTPLICFYMMKDWHRCLRAIEARLPKHQAPAIRQTMRAIDQAIHAYYRAQFRVCVCLAGCYSLGLWIIHLPKAVGLGIITGLLSFIPYVGMAVGFCLTLATAYSHQAPLLPVCMVFGCVQLVDGHLLTPRLLGNGLGIHPVWIIFALLAGGTWFGFWGIVLALPTAATLRVLGQEFWKRRSEHKHASTPPEVPSIPFT